MCEKLKLWIARDGAKDGTTSGSIYLYKTKPEYSCHHKHFRNYDEKSEAVNLEIHLFPEIKNGECRDAEIILGEKL